MPANNMALISPSMLPRRLMATRSGTFLATMSENALIPCLSAKDLFNSTWVIWKRAEAP